MERSFALDETDTFPFILARDLGWSVAQLDALPHREYVQWRAFYTWEAAMRDFEARKRAARRG
jgi:hypothetical protein